ncbi:MAG: endolytic transglycosylase MltG [Kamptonema sp. SIO1D9]|nr:endolytic transglycosylase MltG [Kamptonema sp. SIO1D9]
MKSPVSIFKWLFYLAILPLTVGICGWQAWAWWSWAISPTATSVVSAVESDSIETIQVYIPIGTATEQIGEDLDAAGLIHSALAWKIWAYWLNLTESQGSFKAGTYQLSPHQPLPAIAEKIWSGETVQFSFTIPEGWNIQQMADYLASLGFFPAAEFVTATKIIPQQQYPWLPDGLPHLEGFLFPDTYILGSKNVTPQQVIELMLDRFQEVALPLYEEGKNQTEFSLEEWVTLASIVEKEAVVDSERSRIAGVFVARLARNMRLETDPTVEYGLGIEQTPDQPLTFAQVRTPSPYNTYLNPGLPPTAIASPGKDSLQATLNPENTEFLYFVARYDGTHVFSKTLAEHEAATRAIRQQREAQN